ncbi:reverse transcriptase domain-containing protein [Tanacetum coccineum]
MPPRRLIRSAVERLIADRVAKAIVEHERNRPNPIITGGVVTTNGMVVIHRDLYEWIGPIARCGSNIVAVRSSYIHSLVVDILYALLTNHAANKIDMILPLKDSVLTEWPKAMMNILFVVGLRRWFEKVKQVFEISKCAEEDKVKFAACTFKGRLITWWNGNVHTLGLVNANSIPWNEFKAMMTTEYCPATETQRIEHELWTLTLKGGDIEGYNNRFHELALMCPELVTLEKKIKCYIRGLPKRIKANVTSSKPANLHDVINMARELVEQAIQAKST